MSKLELRYETTRKELLFIVNRLKQFHQYLTAPHFIIHTDHAALSWLRRTLQPMLRRSYVVPAKHLRAALTHLRTSVIASHRYEQLLLICERLSLRAIVSIASADQSPDRTHDPSWGTWPYTVL